MPADTPDMVLVPRSWLESFDRETDPSETIADNGGSVWDFYCHEAERFLSASPLGASGEGALRPASRSSVPTEQAGGPVVGWRPIETAPRDGTPFYARHQSPFRWQPYKPSSEQYRRGTKGRWQTMTEYGGWENCPAPVGDWRPHPDFAAPSTTSTAEQPMRLLVDQAWLDRRVENDPELPCEASPSPGEGEAPVALSASDRACYEYPGVDEQPLRAAFVAGAVFCASARPTPATPEGAEDYYPSHEALHDLVLLISEHEALTGGGPGWSERWRAALLRAEEIVRVEP